MQDQLVLAPIRGYTDFVYNSSFQEHFKGIDFAVAPFITATPSFKVKQEQLKRLLKEKNGKMRVIPQILGKDEPSFLKLVNEFKDFGFKQINWNLACPHPMVRKKRHGSALLLEPDFIASFLEKIYKESNDIRFSIKVRLGVEDKSDILKLIPVFNNFPLEFVAIHPRTAKQMYDGKADFAYLAEIADSFKAPLIYSGDIFKVEDFIKLKEVLPTIKSWMLGRGLLRNPFLAEQIKNPAFSYPEKEKLSKLYSFHNSVFEKYKNLLEGDAHLLDKMKGFWQYHCYLLKNPIKQFHKIKRIKKSSDYSLHVKKLFKEPSLWNWN